MKKKILFLFLFLLSPFFFYIYLLLVAGYDVDRAWTTIFYLSAYIVFSLFNLWPLFLITLIEALIFWLWIKKIMKISIRFLKVLLVVFLANVIAFMSYYLFLKRMRIIVISPLLEIIIDWLVYLIFFRKTIKNWDLLKISFGVNLVSFSLCIFLGVCIFDTVILPPSF